ncbi:hypothetical protein JKP88DRAFT_265967, partial [Tribonema minus]
MTTVWHVYRFCAAGAIAAAGVAAAAALLLRASLLPEKDIWKQDAARYAPLFIATRSKTRSNSSATSGDKSSKKARKNAAQAAALDSKAAIMDKYARGAAAEASKILDDCGGVTRALCRNNYTWCMVTHRLAPQPSVANAYIMKRAWEGDRVQAPAPLLGIELDMMRVRNSVLLLKMLKMIEEAFDNEEVCFLPKDGDNSPRPKLFFHVLNEQLRHQKLLESPYAQDIAKYKDEMIQFDRLYRDHVSKRTSGGAVGGQPPLKALDEMTFGDLEGQELRAHDPQQQLDVYYRALHLHAVQAHITDVDMRANRAEDANETEGAEHAAGVNTEVCEEMAKCTADGAIINRAVKMGAVRRQPAKFGTPPCDWHIHRFMEQMLPPGQKGLLAHPYGTLEGPGEAAVQMSGGATSMKHSEG